MTGAPLVVLGQLLGTATASGLNLYITVAVLGLAARMEWIPVLPPALTGLESPLIIASAVVLYIVEFIADKVRQFDAVWDAIHTVIRPTAAALLALGALDTLPIGTQIGGAAFAGLVALTAHSVKAGLRITLNAVPKPRAALLVSLVEDTAAVALVLLAFIDPDTAFIVGSGAILVALVAARPFWRAFAFGLRALVARLRGFFGRCRWRGLHELPTGMHDLIDPPRIGRAPPRVARAALIGLGSVGAYRNGWLVLMPDAPVFLYRSFFRPRGVPLPVQSVRTETGAWIDKIEVDATDDAYAILLLKDGPPVDLAVADLDRMSS